MARQGRASHPDVFHTGGDFDEQLYMALRRSPWWMISIAFHVFVFLILSMLGGTTARAVERRAIVIGQTLPPVQEDLPPTDEPTKDVHPQDMTVPDPLQVEDPVVAKPQTDNDQPYEEPFGKDKGLSDASFDGPAANNEIGTGPGAGSSPFGRGGHQPGGGGGGGPHKAFDRALEDALRWLAAHQSPNGGWEAAGFDRWCDGKPISDPSRRPHGLGKALYDPGVTGLALCAFLGAGYTNRGKNPYNRTVGRGLRYLKNIQDPEGCFGPRNVQQYIYNHATAALAMVEAYGMTGSPIWKGSAQRALEFIALARNPYYAWRYGVKPGDNDTSVSGWMMMALKSARLVNAEAAGRGATAPLAIDESAFEGIRSWLDKVTDPDTGRVGYVDRGTGSARPQDLVDRFPAEKSEAMTAVGILARVFMGENPAKSAVVKAGARLCTKLLPTWNPADGSVDMYYWYYGTLAMYQVGGPSWKAWRRAMDAAIVQTQRKDTEFCLVKGSWDPIGPWGLEGGRVYSTALMAMCLEIYYRYPRVFGTH
jgi:hypothetical protein